SFGAAAHADQINTSGVICRNFNAGQANDIDAIVTGIQNANPNPRDVICSVPRQPVAVGQETVFFVDGETSTNNFVTCTFFTYAPEGFISNSFTFTQGSRFGFTFFDQRVAFPAFFVGNDDYADLLCTLPGNRNATIFGIMS